MNTHHFLAASCALCMPAFGATIFNDSLADNFDGNGHMDIVSVSVDSTVSDITFTITVNGSIANPTDWGKYLVGISTSPGTGDLGNPVGNPWGRNIRMEDGMNAYIGSWVDSGGGAQAFTYGGGAWTQNAQVGVSLLANSTSMTFQLAALGLSPGQSFLFDVYTTGGNGGDSANDAIANPGQTVTDWQIPYTTPASGEASPVSYTVIPEPAVGALGALGLLGLLRRRR